MLKLLKMLLNYTNFLAATFGWLCVETALSTWTIQQIRKQPPSGGCVLKPDAHQLVEFLSAAATFGWLCVETVYADTNKNIKEMQPPSGGCVLKRGKITPDQLAEMQPPSGGCVLKRLVSCKKSALTKCSHLRVAVC